MAFFYPETEYDSDSKVRIFNDLMAYAMRKNDYNILAHNWILLIITVSSHWFILIWVIWQKKLQEIPNSRFSDTDCQPVQLRILMSMLLFSMKRSLKLIRLVMSWLSCNMFLYRGYDTTLWDKSKTIRKPKKESFSGFSSERVYNCS